MELRNLFAANNSCLYINSKEQLSHTIRETALTIPKCAYRCTLWRNILSTNQCKCRPCLKAITHFSARRLSRNVCFRRITLSSIARFMRFLYFFSAIEYPSGRSVYSRDEREAHASSVEKADPRHGSLARSIHFSWSIFSNKTRRRACNLVSTRSTGTSTYGVWYEKIVHSCTMAI